MTFQDWKAAVDPKVQGSWNLHQQLPKGLDFFILVSSMMGTIGGTSLVAYSAANSYMDALARYRVDKGERATALGLGIIPDSGFLAEDTQRLDGVKGYNKYAYSRLREICAALEVYCDPRPTDQHLPRGVSACQPVFGIRPPAHWRHLEEVPSNYSQPLWGHMHHVPPLPLVSEGGGQPGHGDGRGADDDPSAVRSRRLRALNAAEMMATASLAEAAEIASEALAHRTSSLLGTPEDRVDAEKPMHSYGIDSLSAIDIRNWVWQVFDVELPVFEILGGATFVSAGMSIARKVQLNV